jgi:hypothetical protein
MLNFFNLIAGGASLIANKNEDVLMRYTLVLFGVPII